MGNNAVWKKSPLRCNYRNRSVRYVEKRKYTERRECNIVSETILLFTKIFLITVNKGKKSVGINQIYTEKLIG